MLRLIFILSLIAGCNTSEGVRCNQLDYTSECASGLQCVVPDNCPSLVAFCCPVDKAATSSNCNACPAPDGGDGGATD